MLEQLIILTPIYNDWDSLNILAKKLKLKGLGLNILIINDKSTKKIKLEKESFKHFKNIKVLSLKKNVGSQRAIAIGLSYVRKKNFKFPIFVIDSDGEDNPRHLKKFIDISKHNEDKLIVAIRTIRKENFFLKLIYEIYLIITFILTHKYLRFGNFSLIQFNHLKKILKGNDIWFAYSSSLLSSKIKVKKIFLKKEFRYLGNSHMSYLDLINHAFKILIVFKNRVSFNIIIYNIFFYIFFSKNSILQLLSTFFIIIMYTVFFFVIKKKPKNLLSVIKNIKNIKF